MDSSAGLVVQPVVGALVADDGPLVWVDCEMTGLDESVDRIIEIAVIVTDGRLNPVDEGVNYIVRTPKEVLDGMNEWCITQHGASGLTQACLESPFTPEDVAQRIEEYVKRWVPDNGAGLLAGSTVHADARFLRREIPGLMRHLSYRILDVSSIKASVPFHELCKRWYPSVRAKEQASRTTETAHRALDDIKASIRELQYYQSTIFLPIEPPAPVPPPDRDAPVERKTDM